MMQDGIISRPVDVSIEHWPRQAADTHKSDVSIRLCPNTYS